jgi:hypothetical protein
VFRELKAEYPDKALMIVIAGHRNMSANWGDELEKNCLPVISSMTIAINGIALHQEWISRKTLCQ